jgi:MFS family permease
MLVANLGYALCSGLLLAAFVSGAFQLWQLYALTLANAIFGALESPAYQASVAMLVPDRHRDRANAIQQLTGPAAGVLAPAAAGLLYAAFGVSGAILVDLATFAVAIAVLIVIRIPMPPRTEAGAALQGGLWRQSFDGFRYLAERPALLAFCLVATGINFLLNGVGVLQTPYLLDRVGSVATFGVIIAFVNFGAVAGALMMSAWGGTRPRIHTAMGGIALGGVFLALGGVARTAPTLSLTLGLFMFCLPIVNAAAMSILQAKVAPDVQGRVMAAVGQMAMLLTPAALLAAGPLADNVFEPAARSGGLAAVAWLVGGGVGSGIGLMLVIGGVATTLLGLAFYAVPGFRRIETILPDHVTEAG